VTVVDNNCTDHTAGVVTRHAGTGRIPGLRRIAEPRQGLTPARQCGVRASTADWVAFVDDDCILAPDWIAGALRFAAAHPEAGGFGGRVMPDWGREPPDYLLRHGWLFAAQDHGPEPCEVESLVGAGMALNRRALGEAGWTERPYLADRTGLGHVSGGDVEICYRLTSAGRRLWYVPSLWLDHRVSPKRQRLRDLCRLARGLGAGAELVSLMGSPDPGEWQARVEADIGAQIHRHAASTWYVLKGQYPWHDWLIRCAFLAGQRAQHRALRRDPQLRARLAGVFLPGMQATGGDATKARDGGR